MLGARGCQTGHIKRRRNQTKSCDETVCVFVKSFPLFLSYAFFCLLPRKLLHGENASAVRRPSRNGSAFLPLSCALWQTLWLRRFLLMHRSFDSRFLFSFSSLALCLTVHACMLILLVLGLRLGCHAFSAVVFFALLCLAWLSGLI